jgi:Raf kinase inhibitor-like YbhB/YbcL family protein
MRTRLALGFVVATVGCGNDGSTGSIDAAGSGSSDAASIDSPAAPAFALTSPTIAEGGAIPLTHVCTNKGGTNLSPQLELANVPAGTMSFAIVLTDLSLTPNLVHSAIYDIPGTATGLPADVEKVYAPTDVPGAHQTASYQMSVRGYNGPCPPSAHMYQFKVYALSTATLPGATMSTTKEGVVTAAATNLGTATLTATFTP